MNMNLDSGKGVIIDKTNQAKAAFMTLLEIMNTKFAAEVKRDSEKQVSFIYSKFSPVADCLRKDKVLLRDILSLVQTNLLKILVELKEKDKIYQFFQVNQKQLFIDAKELDVYIKKPPTDLPVGAPTPPISIVMLALVNEYIENYAEALSLWNSLRGKLANMAEGCERTVCILKKKKDIDLIKKYGKWVLEENPQIGLSLFIPDPKKEEQAVEMNPDEVIEFLSMFDKTKDDQFPYLEYYYEYLINKPITPDSYFNVLGTLYIEKLFRLQPRSFQTPSKF